MYIFKDDEELIQFLKENLTIDTEYGYYDSVDVVIKFKEKVIYEKCVC